MSRPGALFRRPAVGLHAEGYPLSAADFFCRLLLAVVFVLAAASKARGRKSLAEFIQTLERFGFPRSWAGVPLAVSVLLAEALAALLLLAAPRVGYALALVLFTGFTAGIALALRRGEAVACRCFGASETPLGAAHLVRNGLLIAVTLSGAVSHWLGPGVPPPLGMSVIVGFVGALAGLFVTRWDDLVFLFQGPVPGSGSSAGTKRKQRG